MEPEVADAESKHFAEIGLTAEGVCRKSYVPDQIKADDEKRQATFVITTGAVDRDNDTIAVDGWDTRHWLKNPVVLFGHRSDLPPVAKGISMVKSAGALRSTVEFPPEGVYDLADTVYAMVKGGFLKATSVGFRAKRGKYAWNEERGGIDFEEQELLEFSIVPVPSNPEALLTLSKDFAGAKAAGVDLQPIRKALDFADAPVGGSSVTDTPVAMAVTPLAIDGAAVGQVIEKAGRRLSSKTEAALRSAHKGASEAVEHLASVLETAEEQMDDDKGFRPVLPGGAQIPETERHEPPPTPLKSVLIVTPAKSEPVFLVHPDNVKAAVVAAVSETVRSEVNRLRGRLD